MPLLRLIRKNQLAYAKSMLSVFVSVWMLLALQPCAMAFDITPAESSDSSGHCMEAMANTGDSAKQAPVPETPKPCPHCDTLLDPSLCQADDWADSKQLIQVVADNTPVFADRLLLLVDMSAFSPPRLGMQFIDTAFYLSQGITPTALHDVSRC